MGDRRRQIADERRARPALGERAFGGVVGGVEIDVRQIADQPVRPAGAGEPGLLARHEFERPVRAEMQHGMRPEILAEVAVEGREGMRRSEAALEQEPHRVTLDAEGRLDSDEDVAEMRAEHEQAAAVALLASRRRTPLPLDLAQVAFAADMVVDGNTQGDIGMGAEACGVADEQPGAQRVGSRGNVDDIASAFCGKQGVVQRSVDAEIGRRPNGAGVGRKAEQHDRQLALVARRLAQLDETRDARRQHGRPLGNDVHVAPADPGAGGGATAEGHRPDRSIEFGNRHHHRRLDRRQAPFVGLPLLDRLEFDGMRGEVGNVERGQGVGRRRRVVVGGTADEREAGQRDERVDDRAAVAQEEFFDRRTVVEPMGESGDDPQPLGLQGRDDAVVMSGIAAQHIGPHHQKTDGAGAAAGRQVLDPFDEPAGRRGMVEADVGVFQRRRRPERAREVPTLAGRIARDEQAHEIGDVLLGAGQPILQGQEIGPDVLCGAGNEAQQPRQLPEHLHLPMPAGAAARLGAAQPLEQRHRPRRRPGHAELAEAREAHDLAGRHRAEHGVAIVATRGQGGLDGADVVLEKQHRRHDDVARGDRLQAACEGGGVAAPFVGRVDGEIEAGQLRPQRRPRAIRRASQMAVHRHDDDADGGHVSDRNALWHRKGSRR